MKSALLTYQHGTWKRHEQSYQGDLSGARLVLCFGGKGRLLKEMPYEALHTHYPQAQIMCCSTAGEIYHDMVLDDSLTIAVFLFESTEVLAQEIDVRHFPDSYTAAKYLVSRFDRKDLAYVMVFSDGALVNGSELARGLAEEGKDLFISGGMAGDDDRFQSTLVGLNKNPEEGKVVAIGFYGQNFKVSHGTQGGWEEFGLEKEITRSESNVLYEIDGQNALELYKKYLGDASQDLPGAALLFPLSVTYPNSEKSVVRTILSIDEAAQSMIFAGDVPLGSKVRFMRSHFGDLNKAAFSAAENAAKNGLPEDTFALLISCVGRKLVLGPLVDEEVEAVKRAFGNKVLLGGMYSYGELSPFNEGGFCHLHNQTMTITSFYELPQPAQ